MAIVINGSTGISATESSSVLGDGVVETADIADGAVTSAKIASGVIPSVPDSALLASYTVSGSAVSSVDFSSLDLSAHKRYRLEVELTNNGSATAYYLFTNNNTTVGNYYSQYVYHSAGTTYIGRNNDADVTYLQAGSKALITIDIGLAGSTIPLYRSFTNDGTGSGVSVKQNTVSANWTATNITQLTFTSNVASQIAVGSTFRLYRGDV